MKQKQQGKQIRTLRELHAAATNRKAVVAPGTRYDKPTPAAWLINLQGEHLFRLLEKGVYLWRTK